MNSHRDNIFPEVINIFAREGDVKNKKILELGQGMDIQFREYFESIGLIYYASDTYIGSNNGNNRFSGHEYFYNSMDALIDFGDEEFDYVFSCHAFEHCENPIQALREMKRVLKIKGKNIIVTPYCCKHHIIDADHDHIFVLNAYQMLRLLHYVGFNSSVMEQKNLSWKEQDFNIISIGVKNE